MALTVRHAFTSGKPDGADASLVQPSHWNADHIIEGTVDGGGGGGIAYGSAEAPTGVITKTIGPTGDYATIQAAIDELSAGTYGNRVRVELQLPEGDHLEPETIYVSGDGARNISIVGARKTFSWGAEINASNTFNYSASAGSLVTVTSDNLTAKRIAINIGADNPLLPATTSQLVVGGFVPGWVVLTPSTATPPSNVESAAVSNCLLRISGVTENAVQFTFTHTDDTVVDLIRDAINGQKFVVRDDTDAYSYFASVVRVQTFTSEPQAHVFFEGAKLNQGFVKEVCFAGNDGFDPAQQSYPESVFFVTAGSDVVLTVPYSYWGGTVWSGAGLAAGSTSSTIIVTDSSAVSSFPEIFVQALYGPSCVHLDRKGACDFGSLSSASKVPAVECRALSEALVRNVYGYFGSHVFSAELSGVLRYGSGTIFGVDLQATEIQASGSTGTYIETII